MSHKIFIGSTAEQMRMAKYIKDYLMGHKGDLDIEVICWFEDFFEQGKYTLETLLEKLPNFSAAILIFSPDDRLILREEEFYCPRDNIVFEAGLCYGVFLDRERTICLTPKMSKGEKFKSPSDILGLNTIIYSAPKEETDLCESLSSANKNIMKALKKVIALLDDKKREESQAKEIKRKEEEHSTKKSHNFTTEKLFRSLYYCAAILATVLFVIGFVLLKGNKFDIAYELLCGSMYLNIFILILQTICKEKNEIEQEGKQLTWIHTLFHVLTVILGILSMLFYVSQSSGFKAICAISIAVTLFSIVMCFCFGMAKDSQNNIWLADAHIVRCIKAIASICIFSVLGADSFRLVFLKLKAGTKVLGFIVRGSESEIEFRFLSVFLFVYVVLYVLCAIIEKKVQNWNKSKSISPLIFYVTWMLQLIVMLILNEEMEKMIN